MFIGDFEEIEIGLKSNYCIEKRNFNPNI